MASFRRLPNKKWQASVLLPMRLPNGNQRRITKTHPSKQVVREWATKIEAQINSGTFVDPRGGDITLREWHDEWIENRMVAWATVEKTAAHWRTYIEPAFGGYPLSHITRPLLRAWVKRLATETCAKCHTTPGLTAGGNLVRHAIKAGTICAGSGKPPGLGAWTVHGAATTLSAMLTAAVSDGLLPANPASRLQLPRADAKPVFFWTKADAEKLATECGVIADDWKVGLMVSLDMYVGLRWGELAGLKRRYINLAEGLIQVAGVQTRRGWRDYPKSKMSRRVVPIPRHLLEPLTIACAKLGPDDIVFPARGGGAWDDTNFRARVFAPALRRAGVPTGTPHDMRHTAASWLVQAGVDLYRVQALLGHESFRTTQRYAHLAPDAFETVIDAWDKDEPPETSMG